VIQQLIQLIITQLVAGMAGEVTNPASRILVGPVASPALNTRPVWALEEGQLDLRQHVGDESSGQPRALEARERIPVNMGTPEGPYALDSQPLEGTVAIKVVYDENLVTEYSETLLAGTDFTVDIPNQEVTIVKDIEGASALRVVYSYVGNATMREFDQAFQITFYSNGYATLDKFLGLTAAIIQTQQALLLEQFNFQSPTSYAANGYTCQVFLQKVRLLRFEQPLRIEGQALGDIMVAMHFQASGQMRLGQSLSGLFGIIESIHTRGQGGAGVNIVPGVG
jgi:hypothetical protein